MQLTLIVVGPSLVFARSAGGTTLNTSVPAGLLPGDDELPMLSTTEIVDQRIQEDHHESLQSNEF